MAVIVGQAVKHEVREKERDNGERPNDQHDPPRWHTVGSGTVEVVTPIPERCNPNLLGTLNYNGSHHPNFRSGTLNTESVGSSY